MNKALIQYLKVSDLSSVKFSLEPSQYSRRDSVCYRPISIAPCYALNGFVCIPFHVKNDSASADTMSYISYEYAATIGEFKCAPAWDRNRFIVSMNIYRCQLLKTVLTNNFATLQGQHHGEQKTITAFC